MKCSFQKGSQMAPSPSGETPPLNQMHRLLLPGQSGILSATIFSVPLSRSFPIVMFVACNRSGGAKWRGETREGGKSCWRNRTCCAERGRKGELQTDAVAQSCVANMLCTH